MTLATELRWRPSCTSPARLCVGWRSKGSLRVVWRALGHGVSLCQVPQAVCAAAMGAQAVGATRQATQLGATAQAVERVGASVG